MVRQQNNRRPRNPQQRRNKEEKKEIGLQEIYAKIQHLKPVFCHSILRAFTKWLEQLTPEQTANVKANLSAAGVDNAANTILHLYFRIKVVKRGKNAQFNWERMNKFAQTNGLFDKPKDKPLDAKTLGQSLARIAQLGSRNQDAAEIIQVLLRDLDEKEQTTFHQVNAGMNFGDAVKILQHITEDSDPEFAARSYRLLPQKERN